MNDIAKNHRNPQRGLVPAVMVAVFLAAVDQTIISTALPRITNDLGNAALYAWVISSYMMATTVFVPISGTIGDIHGRRPVLLFGLAVFALGSLLAGFASSMPLLIACRAIQGIGAGVLTANAFALLGDLYPPEQLARATGILSAVYGVAGAAGPLMGGLLTDHLGWRWIFWINVPASVAIGIVLFLQLPHKSPSQRDPVDIPGAILLTAALLPALAALSWAGEGRSIADSSMVLAITASLLFGVWFLVVERRAERPIIEITLFRHAGFTLAMFSMLGVALAMYAALSYSPLLFQQRMGMTPTQSGAVTVPLIVALTVTSILAGWLMGKGMGTRTLSALGVVVAAAALAWMSTLAADAGPLPAATTMALLGAGLGLTMPTLTLAAQRSVSHDHFGVTTALAKFFRAIGGLIGIVAAGAVIRYYHTSGAVPPADAISAMVAWSAGAMLVTLVLTLAMPGKGKL